MRSYCLKCRIENPRISNISNGKTIVLTKCAIRSKKKSRFVKNQEAKGLLSNLGLKTTLSKVLLLRDILF